MDIAYPDAKSWSLLGAAETMCGSMFHEGVVLPFGFKSTYLPVSFSNWAPKVDTRRPSPVVRQLFKVSSGVWIINSRSWSCCTLYVEQQTNMTVNYSNNKNNSGLRAELLPEVGLRTQHPPGNYLSLIIMPPPILRMSPPVMDSFTQRSGRFPIAAFTFPHLPVRNHKTVLPN